MSFRKLVRTLTVVGAVVGIGAVPAAAQTPPPMPSAGGLAELTGSQTCGAASVAEDTSSAGPGCQAFMPLLGARPSVVSADGRFAYVAGGTDAFTIFGHGSGYGGLLVLGRDPATGTLTPVQCLSNDTSDGGGRVACDPLTAAVAPSGVALSPDGAAMAMVSSGSGSLTLLQRDPETGKLTELGCAQEAVPYQGTCRTAPTMEGVADVVFSPDTRDIYAASPVRSAITQIRLEEDGTLTRRCFSTDATSGSCTRVPQLVGPSTITVSADGRTVYALTTLGVTWLTRDPATGALTPGGCVVPATGAPCGSGRGAAEVSGSYASGRRLAVNPAGDTFITSSGVYSGDDMLTVLRRTEDGSLQRTGCLRQIPFEEPYEEDPVDEEESDDEEEDAAAGLRQAPACAQAPALPFGGDLLALTDGRFLVTGYGMAAVVAVDGAGVPRADGCLAQDDNRCAVAQRVGTAAGGSALPGGGALLVGTTVTQLVAAPTVTARSAGGGAVRVSLACPADGGGCAATGTVGSLGANLRSAAAMASGARGTLALAAGHRGSVSLALPKGARRARAALTVRSGGRAFAVTAPVAGLRRAALATGPARCPSGTLVARRGSARVVRTKGGTTIGCLAGSRPVRLDRVGGKAATGPVAVAGRFAAVTLRSATGSGKAHTAVLVVDLRRDRIHRLVPAAGRPVASAVAALVLKPSGAVAWTSCASPTARCTGARGDELHLEDGAGSRTAVVARRRITALRLAGSSLRFEVAGAARTVPLA